MVAGLHLAEDGRARLHLGSGADRGAGHQRAARPDAGTGTDADGTDVDDVTVNPPAGKIHLRLHVGAAAEGKQPGDRRQRVQLDVIADLGAQGPGVVRHPRCAGQADGAGQVLDLFRQPQAQVYPSGPRVRARHHLAEQDPGRGDGDQHAAGRGDEHQPGRGHPPPGHGGGSAEARERGQQVVGRHQVGQPAHPHQDVQGNAHQRLEDLRLERGGADGPFRRRSGGHPFRKGLAGRINQRTDSGRRIDVGDSDGGIAHPEGGDQLGGRQGAAAVGEEVGVEAGYRAAQDGGPLFGNPGGVFGQVQRCGVGICCTGPGQRPGQRMAVHLAAGFGGQRFHHSQQRNERGGQACRQVFAGGHQVQIRVCGGQVAHQDLVAGRGCLDGRRSSGDVGEGLQGSVNFTQFDPASAQLDLFISAAHKDQAFGFVADQVAGTVGALPAEGWASARTSPGPCPGPGSGPVRRRR